MLSLSLFPKKRKRKNGLYKVSKKDNHTNKMVCKIIMLSAYVGSILNFRTDSLILKDRVRTSCHLSPLYPLFFYFKE